MLQAQVGQPPAPVGFLFPVFQIERYYISNIFRLASIVDQQGPRDIFYDFGWPEYFFQRYHYGGNYFLPLLGNARKKTFVRYSLTISILLSAIFSMLLRTHWLTKAYRSRSEICMISSYILYKYCLHIVLLYCFSRF